MGRVDPPRMAGQVIVLDDSESEEELPRFGYLISRKQGSEL